LPEQSFSLFLKEIGDATEQLGQLVEVTRQIADAQSAPATEGSNWVRARLWKQSYDGLSSKQVKKFLADLSLVRTFFVKNIFQPAST
jgi:hypothetical protein